jgi:hypothetical protein
MNEHMGQRSGAMSRIVTSRQSAKLAMYLGHSVPGIHSEGDQFKDPC